MYRIPAIRASELVERLGQRADTLRLVDVRSPAEFNQGVIEGAECVPLHLVPLQAAEWVADGRPIVFYCRSGARSGQATLFLSRQAPGLEVLNLTGGLHAWLQAGGGLVEHRRTA